MRARLYSGARRRRRAPVRSVLVAGLVAILALPAAAQARDSSLGDKSDSKSDDKKSDDKKSDESSNTGGSSGLAATGRKQRGIWLSQEEIAALPTSGPGWSKVHQAADGSFESASLTDRNHHNTQVLAAALVGARTESGNYKRKVRDELLKTMSSSISDGDVLAATRRLGTYVIAADLIDLKHFDPATDQKFRGWLRKAVRHEFSGGGGGGSVISVHERRPNNFGTHAGASRMATAIYLGDTADLQRAAAVFKGWAGERSSYSGFKYGDMSWQANRSAPVGVNPVGAKIKGTNVDGVLPDDQRRGGGFKSPPPAENYVWEAMQGATMQAEILDRQGYNSWKWGDQAVKRAAVWLHNGPDFPAEGDDTWLPWLLNANYGTSFPAKVSSPGKNMGFTDWTHAKRSTGSRPASGAITPASSDPLDTATSAASSAAGDDDATADKDSRSGEDKDKSEDKGEGKDEGEDKKKKRRKARDDKD